MFNFGKNWKNYSERLNQEDFNEAQKSLINLLGIEDLKDKSFIDIGCGSGIFSIAAKKIGANRVLGIDILPSCIECSRNNALKFNEKDIDFRQFSILDPKIKGLGKFDVVYTWGSLHHTGNMYKALEVSCEIVKEDGYLAVAIYNKNFTSRFWWVIKWLYNHSPWIGKKILEVWYLGMIIPLKILILGKNVFRKERGMKIYYDAIDWLGGYPYEYASIGEIKNFVESRDFILKRVIKPTGVSGCNQYLFKKHNEK